LVADHVIDDAVGKALLTTALEAFDSMRASQAQIERDGATFKDRFGQLRSHPLLPVVRDSRAQFLAALKALNLDLVPTSTPRVGRPAGR